MSGNPPDNTVSGENQSTSTTPPPVPPAYTIPNAQNQVACPKCFTLVPTGTRFCPQCGNAIPPPAPWTVPAPEARRNVALIVAAAVLIVVLVGGVAGYLVYQQNQRVLQDAKNSEANGASQAPSQLQITCFSNRTDNSNLYYSSTTGYSGTTTVYETFGVDNPTNFAMDVTWTITFDFTSLGWVLTNSRTFFLPANGGLAYPEFGFTVTGNQLNNKPANADPSIFTVTLDGTYNVTGTYSTYHPTTHQSFNSASGGGSGNLNGSGGPPKCPLIS